MIKLIYLACPFRHTDPLTQRKRCAAVHYTAAQIFLEGKHVISHHTHNEPLIDIIDDAVPGEHWMQFDLAILAHCKLLYVLAMEGWELSKGVAREIAFAKERGIAIQMIAPPKEELYEKIVKTKDG
jgi:hypothetical protein